MIQAVLFVEDRKQPVANRRGNAGDNAEQPVARRAAARAERQYDNAGKGHDHGNRFFDRQRFPEQKAGKKDDHHRPEVVEDTRLL